MREGVPPIGPQPPLGSPPTAQRRFAAQSPQLKDEMDAATVPPGGRRVAGERLTEMLRVGHESDALRAARASAIRPLQPEIAQLVFVTSTESGGSPTGAYREFGVRGREALAGALAERTERDPHGHLPTEAFLSFTHT
jgi:hypothetical protein